MEFEFQSTLDAIDADTATGAIVPVTYRGLYSNADGKFTLDGTLAKKLDVSGLSGALDKERKANRTVKDLVEKWTKLGATPEEVQTKINELTEAATKGDKVNFDKLKADMERGHVAALTAKDVEVQAANKTVAKYLVDTAAITAISEAKGAAELLLPHVRNSVKVVQENGEFVVRVIDADGDPRGDGKGGLMTIKDLIVEMKASPVFGRAFEASGATGSGKQPGSGTQKTSVAAGTGRDQMSPTQMIQAGLAKKR